MSTPGLAQPLSYSLLYIDHDTRLALREDFKELLKPAHFDGLEQLYAEAHAREVSMAGLAMAWLINRPDVAMVNIGTSRRPPYLGHIEEASTIEVDDELAQRLTSFFSD